MKQLWPAPERNKEPLLAVLKTILPKQGSLLEIAGGSGQHAVFFAAKLPQWKIQSSDTDPENLASIRAWVEETPLANLGAPLSIDVLQPDWQVDAVDAIYCANMIHIAPWECTLGLMHGAGIHLKDDGLLITYGPYQIDGQHTAPSNAVFDENLKSRNPEWGVRNLNAVIDVAASHGLSYSHHVTMPANNQTVIFRKQNSLS